MMRVSSWARHRQTPLEVDTWFRRLQLVRGVRYTGSMRTKLPLLLSLPVVLPALFSCGSAPSAGDSPRALVSQTQALADGTPAALGVLTFLNDPSTTLAVLDTGVPLNVQAAQGLIDWREGPDGVLYTADDRRFVSIEQVDAVPYVGPAALATLEAYARGTGRVELPLDGHVGTFHGVGFHLAEARRALKAANVESAAALQGAGLTSAAVQSILAARPIIHLVELSRLPSVDSTALQSLKVMTWLAPEGDPCTGAGTCQSGLTCEGVPQDGSSSHGRCRNHTVIPGNGENCSVFAPCQSGLVCTGIPSGAVEGICRPAWMAADFTHYADVGLPGSSAGVESSLAVVGLATVPVDITVELDMVHASPSNLVLTLEDPGGETALLWDGPNEGRPPARIPVTRGIPRDGSVNGRWRLRVTNPSGVGSGRLREWRLKLTSRWD